MLAILWISIWKVIPLNDTSFLLLKKKESINFFCVYLHSPKFGRHMALKNALCIFKNIDSNPYIVFNGYLLTFLLLNDSFSCIFYYPRRKNSDQKKGQLETRSKAKTN